MAYYDAGSFDAMQTSANELGTSATDFYDKLAGYTQGKYNLAQDQALKEQQKHAFSTGVEKQGRGLLYSGSNVGAGQEETASGLAAGRAETNIGARSQAAQNLTAAATGGLSATEIRRNAAWAMYGQGYKQAQQRWGLTSGLIGGFGKAAGAVAGGMGGGGGAGLETATPSSANNASWNNLGVEGFQSSGPSSQPGWNLGMDQGPAQGGNYGGLGVDTNMGY